MNYPTIAGEAEMLNKYAYKNGYTSAVLATDLSTFGGTWWEDHVDDLRKGKVKPTSHEKIFIRLFLLNEFYDYNCS